MAKTKANEREFQGKVISWILKRLGEGGLPFQNATNDSSLYGLETTKFPDVLITLDFECLAPFCGWELKTPKTDVRDSKLLKDAIKKAQVLGAKYFVTWNMQTAIIWRTPEKTKAIVNENDNVRELPLAHQITKVDDIRNQTKAQILENACRQLLFDLARLHEDERINLPVADTTIFVAMVSAASDKMAETILTDIKKARADRKFDKRLNAWAKKQGVSKYDQDYYHTLAQQMAYKIIGKLLFYLTLRRHNLNLPKLDLRADNYRNTIKNMRSLFQLALEVDYQAIFETDITDEIKLSENTANYIVELTNNLTHWSFELMPLDVIGNVFEKLVPEDARHSLGQYFTPENLVDLITAFCVKNENDFVMDPTCGTGTFLIRAYNRLRTLGIKRRPHHKLLGQIWGFDIAGFPAELATINLFRQNLIDYLNFPRVLTRDFFDVQPGDTFEFPPPKKTIKTGDRISVQIPKFDVLVGNFPFIRQELIEKEEKGYKKKLEKVLFDNWGTKYPDLFRDINNNKNHKLRLSGQADIYAYLYFHSAAHLKPNGRMGFITSNSWLDVAYGYELQKFFLSKFKLIGIFESRCEPWFEQSAVNTVFTILERCDDKKERNTNDVRFVKVKKPLAEMFPHDAVIDAQSRWLSIERFVDEIEDLKCSSYSKKAKNFKEFQSINEKNVKQPKIISYEDENVRVRLISQEDLASQLLDTGHTVKWGQYLRAPDIYFKILDECADKLVPLSEIANIRRGITTGINDFFYLTKEQAKHRCIEKEFLKPVVTSTREIPGVFVEDENLPWRVFLCHKEKKQLYGTGAAKYIKWGQNETTSNGTKWPEVPSVQGRKNWYSLPENSKADFLLLRFRDRRHYTPINKAKAVIGDVVFVGDFYKRTYKNFGFAFLNSALTALFSEVFGRTNLGDGLLTTYGPELDSFLIPDIFEKPIDNKITKVLEAFNKLGKRNVLSFHQEVKQSDRKKFEKAIFSVLGLGEGEVKDVFKAVNELIEERHIIPKLRKVKKKKRVTQDWAKLREQVIEEVLPNGVKKFPDAYITGFSRMACDEVSVPATTVKLGENFFGSQQLCDADGNHIMDQPNEAIAKFIVYAKKPDEHIVRVPHKMMVVKKAVQDYELDVKEIKDKLYTAFMEKSGDHNASKNLAEQVCEEFGLPDIR